MDGNCSGEKAVAVRAQRLFMKRQCGIAFAQAWEGRMCLLRLRRKAEAIGAGSEMRRPRLLRLATWRRRVVRVCCGMRRYQVANAFAASSEASSRRTVGRSTSGGC